MIFNLGSINADFFYEVPHLPQPGETLAAAAFATGLGGKGANMSVAVARAGGDVRHIGAVGPDGAWAVERLAADGVDIAHVAVVEVPTGHATINVDSQGENTIVIFAGANREQSEARIKTALQDARQGDTLALQNETNGKNFAVARAKEKGMRVLYAAAPFDEQAARGVLPYADVLVLNEIEFRQLQQTTGKHAASLGVETIVVTRGAQGAQIFEQSAGWDAEEIPAPLVKAVDTTGAGDTFAGYLAAGLDDGFPATQAVIRAVWAAALKVTRPGTADAIPSVAEVQSFMG